MAREVKITYQAKNKGQFSHLEEKMSQLMEHTTFNYSGISLIVSGSDNYLTIRPEGEKKVEQLTYKGGGSISLSHFSTEQQLTIEHDGVQYQIILGDH